MTVSSSAKEAWTRNLNNSGTKGYAKLVSGYGTVDFESSTRSSDTLVETDLTAIVANYDANELGELIQKNDLRVTCDSSATIDQEDKIKIGTQDALYRIVNKREVNFAGSLVGYVLQVRL